MKFYNREDEIGLLKEIQKASLNNAQFTVVTGRRRIGKTSLLLYATAEQPTLYFFVARKAESYLCQDFQQEIQNKLGIPILGEITNFGRLFEFLMVIFIREGIAEYGQIAIAPTGFGIKKEQFKVGEILAPK